MCLAQVGSQMIVYHVKEFHSFVYFNIILGHALLRFREQQRYII